MARLLLSPFVSWIYGVAVGNRRARVLATHIADAIPQRGTVLDLGCGDGAVAVALARLRPDLRIQGADIEVRPDARIPVVAYDGETLPFEDDAFDYVMLVDVLHHAPDPTALLVEAARVARAGLVLKDHLREGLLAAPTLRLMERVGGVVHRESPPSGYLSRKEWEAMFYRLRFATVSHVERLGLYPLPFNWLFDRTLHFVVLLGPRQRLG